MLPLENAASYLSLRWDEVSLRGASFPCLAPGQPLVAALRHGDWDDRASISRVGGGWHPLHHLVRRAACRGELCHLAKAPCTRRCLRAVCRCGALAAIRVNVFTQA